jgi:hypothetical protein
MKATDVADVLALAEILESPAHSHTPEGKAYLIAALVEWRDSSKVVATVAGWPDEGTTAKPKAKRGKAATTSDPSVSDVTDDEPDF